MAKYYANITLMIDLFEADSGDDAGQVVNDYITKLANLIEDAKDIDLVWEDCDFVIYETEDE